MKYMPSDASKSDIIGYECKHAIYSASMRHGSDDSIVFIKERVHLKDGRTFPNTRIIKNPKRSFWITREHFRNHEEHKEWEYLERLQEFETTQPQMPNAIMRALNLRQQFRGLRNLFQNPYIYGADISITAIIKRKYMDKWPNLTTPNSLAVFDLETDVIHGTGDPIYGSITYKDKAILTVSEWFLKQCPGWDKDPKLFEDELKVYFKDRIKNLEEIDSRNIQLEVQVVPTALDVVRVLFERAHEWQPDFISAWNADFDISRTLETIEKYGGDPADIFVDSSVPKEYRRVWYQKGPTKKVTEAGQETPVLWYDQWHTLHACASFYMVDQAAVFRKVRFGSGNEPMGLDAVLKKHTKVQKLKNEKADRFIKLDWHVYMQKNMPLEYGVYNIIDCVGCEILDEQPKVRDISTSISLQCAHSDYSKFGSQPRRTVDDLHFEYLNDKVPAVIGVTPSSLKTEYDAACVSVNGWIITLPAHLVIDNGLQLIKEVPNLRTGIRVAVYDLDVSAAYPNGEDVLNASKATTIMELVAIQGVGEDVTRPIGINLTAGPVNAVEIVSSVCKAPTLENFIIDYMEHELRG